jgi:hypothetical protein
VAGVQSHSEVAFNYSALSKPPRIAHVAPLAGPASGGTRVTITGEAFGDSALVMFVENDVSGMPTGNQSECVWRGTAGMSCNDSVIQCVSPTLTTAGRMFNVSVTSYGVPTVYSNDDPSRPSHWVYDAPVITAMSSLLEMPPQPAPDAAVSISGRNFGAARGVVIAGLRELECLEWSDGDIACAQPPGVAASVNVTVVAASGLVSAQAGNLTQLSFHPPAVVAVEPAAVLSSTAGGGRLNVSGANFAHPLPVFAWLVRVHGAGSLPWTSSGPMPSQDAMECPVIPGTVTSASLACSVPPGSGTGWGLLVVNHDNVTASPGAFVMDAVPALRLRASVMAPNFSLAYAAPVLASKQLVVLDGGAPAIGGFVLRLTGANFGVLPPLVTVGALPCSVLPGSHSHDSLECRVPNRQVDGDSLIRVAVDGQSSEPLAFSYDPPVVTRVAPGDILARAPAGRSRLTLQGVNFGVRYRAGLTVPHVIFVGSLPCTSVVWIDDTELSCVPEGEVAAGPLNVTLTLAGVTSAPVAMVAGCPAGWYARLGDRCTSCPAGARCAGGGAFPVSLPGHFPLALAVFVECVPRAACAGGISAPDLAVRGDQNSTGCSRLYVGDRCAECAAGAYRLKGKCASCPNTAWLLFFGFAVAITAAVALAVYLAGKRINMAGLSIGVVSVGA